MAAEDPFVTRWADDFSQANYDNIDDVTLLTFAKDASRTFKRVHHLVLYKTKAEATAEAAGTPGQLPLSSLEDIDPLDLCLGSTASVDRAALTAWRLAYDSRVAGSPGQLRVFLDDRFVRLPERAGNADGLFPAVWVALGSLEEVAINVPPYSPQVFYPVGYLIRHTLPASPEGFFYSLRAGQLPAPVATKDTNWRATLPPVSPTQLAQFVTLAEAQGLDGAGVVHGRRYGIRGKWNGSQVAELVEVDGFENEFRKRGTLLRDDGTQLEVEVNVQAETYVGTGEHAAPAGTTSVTLTASAPTDYGTALGGTFTIDPTACVVGKVVRFALAAGAGAPVFNAAPAGQPYHYYGVPYAAGKAFSYSLLVCVDRIEVVILADD